MCIRDSIGVDRAQERIAQADLRDADVAQRGDGRNAFLVHPGQARDERLKRRGGIGFKEGLEALRRQAGHAGPQELEIMRAKNILMN